LEEIHATGGTGNAAHGPEVLLLAELDAQLHDVESASLRLAPAVWRHDYVLDVAEAEYAQALLAEETGNLSGAAKHWDTFVEVYSNLEVANKMPSTICHAAPVYAKLGDTAKADAALDAPIKVFGIGTYVDCYRFRGDVLELRGDWAGAQDWYAKAVKLAPSLPAGYYGWGVALAKHRDFVAAAAKLEQATERGPHWADPLKAWGDVLVNQGHAQEALAKYDKALQYARNWKQLKNARGAVAQQKP
jgi:tetratricopeptide (TPR) repeat protein